MPYVTVDRDLIFCPITLQVFRHPVHVNGHFYELSALLKHIRKNGLVDVYRQPITDIAYARLLKNSLDDKANQIEDRFKEYDKEPLLNELKQLLKPSRSFSLSTGGTVAGLGLLLYVTKRFEMSDILETVYASHSLELMVLSTLADYAIRCISRDRFGLFSPLQYCSQLVQQGMEISAEGVADLANDIYQQLLQQDNHPHIGYAQML